MLKLTLPLDVYFDRAHSVLLQIRQGNAARREEYRLAKDAAHRLSKRVKNPETQLALMQLASMMENLENGVYLPTPNTQTRAARAIPFLLRARAEWDSKRSATESLSGSPTGTSQGRCATFRLEYPLSASPVAARYSSKRHSSDSGRQGW